MAKAVYTVGRFQPPTIGHRMLIDRVLSEAKRIGGDAYVFVSSVTTDPARNPLTSAQKIKLLENLFPKSTGVTFVDTANCKPSCGGPGRALTWLVDTKKYEAKNVTVVLGAERADPESSDFFGDGASIWGRGENKRQPGGFLRLGHQSKREIDRPANEEEHMSGTKARSYVTETNDRIADFYTAVGYVYESTTPNPDVESVYNTIYKIKFSKDRQSGGEGEEPDKEIEKEELVAAGPDGEDIKPKPTAGRVTRRNRASSRALYRRGSRSRNGSLKTSRS